MRNVFEYTDYRQYLQDYYDSKKRENPNYSYKVFSDNAGFKDKSCIYSVIKGRRKLSGSGVFKVSQYLKHNRSEAEYFASLVSLNQAQNLKEKNFHFDKLCSLRSAGNPQAAQSRKLRKDQYEYYSKWYHAMIRSLLDIHEFTDDYKWLAKMLSPGITPLQAKKSIQLLERLGLIEKRKNGTYTVTQKSLTTGQEVRSLAVQNFHTACTDLAKRAIAEIPSEIRNITGLTMGISDKTYEKVCEEIQKFQAKLIELAETDEEPERVYQLNFALFPTTQKESERNRI